MQIQSSKVVKFGLLPAVVVIAVFVGIKSCSPTKMVSTSTGPTVLPSLSLEEMKALGVEGDTPEDTLKTLVGRLNDIRRAQQALSKTNEQLAKENDRLRQGSKNVDGRISTAVAGLKDEYSKREQQLQNKQDELLQKIHELGGRVDTQLAENKEADKGSGSDIPLGLGLDGLGSEGGAAAPGADGLMWVSPSDMQEADPKKTNSGPTFATSFLDDNPLTRQKAAYEQQVKGYTNEHGADAAKAAIDPVWTIPENSTLIGSRAMTALLGRIPLNGTVTDPYPFKVLIGKDNLAANGIDIPEMEGAVVSGTASGDWTLSCVRGQVNSITFIFTDGTVRTVPQPSANATNNTNQASAQNKVDTSSGIGWISDENGIPCIGGERKSNASTYLPTLFGLSAAEAGGNALTQNQQTTQTNGYGGTTSSLTGDAGKAVLGGAISGGMSETTEWVKQRYGQTFDAIYVPPGVKLAVHITRQLAIDYDENGRKVRYDFSVPGDINTASGLD
uniref:TIGR03752 family integrating conjugative element protein n=1 Tax=Scandinavium goeteborgense TaxID=1851514 RepID=UPI00135B9725|nr:TIGR03752 family integrating conjugative element protein [Scandinavium goeteborgense]